MIVYADEYKEVNDVKSGNIVAVTGLKVCSCVFSYKTISVLTIYFIV